MGEVIHKVRMTRQLWIWLFAAMVLGFVGMMSFIPGQPPIAKWSLLGSAILVLLVFPDMRAVYGTDGIMLTFGLNGMWKKRIPRDDVTYISVVGFNPMRHFGGWGIKYGRGEFRGVLMWAMPTGESRGILVETVSGKKFLIGDDDPEMTIATLSSLYPVDPGAGLM